VRNDGDVDLRVLVLFDVDRTVGAGGAPVVVAVGGTKHLLFENSFKKREALQPCAMAMQGELRGGKHSSIRRHAQ